MVCFIEGSSFSLSPCLILFIFIALLPLPHTNLLLLIGKPEQKAMVATVGCPSNYSLFFLADRILILVKGNMPNLWE